jgi:hypothetical protein
MASPGWQYLAFIDERLKHPAGLEPQLLALLRERREAYVFKRVTGIEATPAVRQAIFAFVFRAPLRLDSDNIVNYWPLLKRSRRDLKLDLNGNLLLPQDVWHYVRGVLVSVGLVLFGLGFGGWLLYVLAESGAFSISRVGGRTAVLRLFGSVLVVAWFLWPVVTDVMTSGSSLLLARALEKSQRAPNDKGVQLIEQRDPQNTDVVVSD